MDINYIHYDTLQYTTIDLRYTSIHSDTLTIHIVRCVVSILEVYRECMGLQRPQNPPAAKFALYTFVFSNQFLQWVSSS